MFKLIFGTSIYNITPHLSSENDCLLTITCFLFYFIFKKILNISFIERLHPGTADINEIFLLNLLEKYFNFFLLKHIIS